MCNVELFNGCSEARFPSARNRTPFRNSAKDSHSRNQRSSSDQRRDFEEREVCLLHPGCADERLRRLKLGWLLQLAWLFYLHGSILRLLGPLCGCLTTEEGTERERATSFRRSGPFPVAIPSNSLLSNFRERLGGFQLLGLLQGFLCHVFVLPLNLPLWGRCHCYLQLWRHSA